jgi:hypothetical protein
MDSVLGRLARRVRAFVAECNDAQRRLAALREDPERYVLEPDRAPESYQEFRMRAARPLVHEPSAQARAKQLKARLGAVPQSRAEPGDGGRERVRWRGCVPEHERLRVHDAGRPEAAHAVQRQAPAGAGRDDVRPAHPGRQQ